MYMHIERCLNGPEQTGKYVIIYLVKLVVCHFWFCEVRRLLCHTPCMLVLLSFFTDTCLFLLLV